MNIQQLLDAAEPVSRYLPTAGVDYINRLVKALRESTAREEQLGEQVRLLTEQLEVSISAERVWETTMMEACGEDGPASVAAEIKSLREQRDAVVVESAQFKTAIKALSATAEECELNGDELRYVVGTDEFEHLTDLLDETPTTSSAIDALREEAKSEVIEWLDAEISAIDPIYRGSPSYEHDAYWMKCRVHDLLEKSKNLFGQLRESKGANHE